MQGNRLFWDGIKNGVAEKVSNAINRLGILEDKREEMYVEAIRGMNQRGK